MTGKSPLYTIAQIVTLAILLVCNGFILDFILKLENGFTIDKVCKLPKECQTKYESSIFGFDPSQFHLDISKIDNGQSLSEILKLYSVPSDRSEKILKEISTVIDLSNICLLYTSDAADERSSVDLGGRRIIKKKTHK